MPEQAEEPKQAEFINIDEGGKEMAIPIEEEDLGEVEQVPSVPVPLHDKEMEAPYVEDPYVEDPYKPGDLTDLFEVTSEDVMGDGAEDLDDLTEVSQADIMGGDDEDLADLTDVSQDDIMGSPDGDISDLVNVSDEDIMGSPPPSGLPTVKKQVRITPTGRRIVRRTAPPTSMSGLG